MQLMREGAGLLLGRHDFLPFSRAHRKKSTSKELYDIDIRASDATVSTLKITVTADDFLYQMPSLIIGALLEIGRGTRTPQSILHIFQGTEKAEALCESKGLLLKSIQYKTIF